MPATRTNNTITITGVETDLSSLAGITGVETFQKGNKITYLLNFSGSRLSINADLEIDPEKEELVFLSDSANDCIRVENGAIFKVGKETIVDGIVRYSQGDVLFMPNDSSAQFLINSLDVRSGGRFEWRGGNIYAGDAMGCSIGGTAELFAGTFITTSTLTNTTNSSAMVMRNDGLPNDVISHNIILDSLNPTTAAPVVFSRNGLNTFVFSARAGFAQQRNGTWTDALVLRGAEFGNNAFIYDYNFVGNNNNYGSDRVQPAEFFNVDVGTGLRQFSATNNLNGHISFFQELRVNVTGLDGSAIEGVIVRVPTIDHGNRIDDTRPLFQNSRSFSNDEFNLSEATTDSTGEVFFNELLTGRMWVRSSNTEQLDLYSNSGIAGQDDFTAQFISYNNLPSFENLILHSSSEILVNKVLLPDSSLTELDSTVVSNYTSINNAPEFYDSAKLYLVNNFKGEQNTIVNIAGSDIDAGGYDVVIDANATLPFAFDNSTITIKTGLFNGSIITSGNIELKNGSLVEEGEFRELTFVSGHGSNIVLNNVIATELTNESGIDINVFTPNAFIANETTGSLSLIDSTVNITTPAGYNAEIKVFSSAQDALDEVNEIATGASFNYPSSLYGGQTLYFRVEDANGLPAIGSHLLDPGAGIFEVNVATTEESSALGTILATVLEVRANVNLIADKNP